MTQFEVDPDSLVAAAEVADRQAGHLATAAHYVADVCGRTEAFGGVLSMFRASYQEALEAVQAGLHESRTVSEKAREAFTGCALAYLDADRESWDSFRSVYGDDLDLAPYQPPGSGQAAPGDPICPPGTGPEAESGAIEVPRLSRWVSAPLGRVAPGQERPVASWIAPLDPAKKAVLEPAREYLRDRGYLKLRATGLTPSEALDQAKHWGQMRTETHVATRMWDAQEDAYKQAYREALTESHTVEEARRKADDAAARIATRDSIDVQHRVDVAEGIGTYTGALGETADLVENVQKIGADVKRIGETRQDLADYETFEADERHDAAERWADR